MCNRLLELLKITPGVISSQHYQVDPSDWLKMLTMYDPQTVFRVGNWIRVGKGKYKGDVGFVVGVESWVEVLLVPRLGQPTTVDTLKRKRTTLRSKPALFDPATIKRVHDVNPRCEREGIYTVWGLEFEHGLLRKAYDFHSLSPTTTIPSYLFSLFQLSQHPVILSSTFPQPQEWIFEEGDQVIVRSSGELVTITAVEPSHLEACYSHGLGTIAVQWSDVRKAIKVGDYVEVTSGSLIGAAGWVDCIDEVIVHILEKVSGSTSLDAVKVCPRKSDLFYFY